MRQPAPKRSNMTQFPVNMQAEFDRDAIFRIIENQPGITMLGIAKAIGKAKSTAHLHTGFLIADGRVEPVSLGKRIAYYVADSDMPTERTTRHDYPKQIMVAAVDHAKLPAMDELTACLFGRKVAA